jgi:hypothetical protein
MPDGGGYGELSISSRSRIHILASFIIITILKSLFIYKKFAKISIVYSKGCPLI